MPLYNYHCPENGRDYEVSHPSDVKVTTWKELCAYAGMFQGALADDTPVERIFTSAPGVHTPKGNADLKNLGITKLVRRDDGVYENVTATDDEKRYMSHDDPDSMPNLDKKIED